VAEPRNARNAGAIGYDMFSEPIRRAALEAARDSGNPTASGKVTLVQETEAAKQPGFLLYVPVYRGPDPGHVEGRRRALRGFVFGAFRMGDLMRGLFGSEAQPRVEFSIHDGEQMTPATLLFGSENAGAVGRFQERSRIVVAGRPWTILFRSSNGFEAQSSQRITPFLLLAGLLVSAALFAISRAQHRARADAEAAEQQRAELLKQERLARAEAEAQRANLSTLFNQAPAAIAILGRPDYRYELSNPANQELSGGRAVVGVTVREAVPELEAQGLLAVLDHVVKTGEPFVGTALPVSLRTPGGPRTAYLTGTYQPLRDGAGAITGVMAFAYEVTELVEAKQRVEQAVSIRDEFLSIAGHELRTPLTALQLQLQGLQVQLQGPALASPERLSQRLGKAIAQVQRLAKLVDQLLDVSRIAAGRLAMQPERVELQTMIADVVDRFAEQSARVGSRIDCDVPEPIVGTWDRVRLDQVLTNLISNALKYGAGQPVSVRASAIAGGGVRIAVQDRGIGIAPEYHARIFGRFERAVSERNYGGLGLGLWISREIVTGMGGRIGFESNREGQGTTFVVDLPLDSTAAAATTSAHV
jgi:signal transduction histidine kinase